MLYRWHPQRACGNLPCTSNQFLADAAAPALNEILSMDPKEIIEFLHTTARSLGAEVTSPWFYLQFGLILTGAGIAYASDAAIRARVDMTSFAMGLPLPLRHFARVLVYSASTAVFAILMIAARITMYHSTWPSRSGRARSG